MTTPQDNYMEFGNGPELVVPAAFVEPFQDVTSYPRIKKTLFRSAVCGAGLGLAYVGGLFTADVIHESTSAGSFVVQQNQILLEQQGVSVPEMPDALARASTVQLKTLCEINNKPKKVVEGTGALYRTAAGRLALGTVTHVVTFQLGGNSTEDPPCWIVGSVDTGDKIIKIPFSQDEFKGAFKEPTSLKAVMDQPALVKLPKDVSAVIESAVTDGLLTPLTINSRATQDAAMIIRQKDSVGPMTVLDNTQVTFLKITGASAEYVEFVAENGTNVCYGNSGSPILRIEDGQITNQSFGVLSNMETLDLGSKQKQICSQDGSLISYQVQR